MSAETTRANPDLAINKRNVTAVVAAVLALNGCGNKTEKSVIPETLPVAVTQNHDAVLKVVGTKNQYQSAASGIKISGNLALTAGHVIRDTVDKKYCGLLGVQGVTNKPTAASYVPRSMTQSDASNLTSSPDWALMQVSGTEFGKLPIPKATFEIPEKGSPVFFLNFQPNSLGQARSPLMKPGSLKGMARIAGIVLANKPPYTIIATGFKSYGEDISQMNTIPGSSGGPVFVGSGRLFGTNNSIDPPVPEKQVEQKYTIELPGPDENPVGVAYVQQLAYPLQSENYKQLNAARSC